MQFKCWNHFCFPPNLFSPHQIICQTHLHQIFSLFTKSSVRLINCHFVLLQCVTRECQTSQQCQQKYSKKIFCFHGKCEYPFTQCVKDGDCMKGYKCDHKVCKVKVCSDGLILINKKCEQSYTCNSQFACPESMMCYEGSCVERTCPEHACPISHSCVDNQCILTECRKDQDCMSSKCNKFTKTCEQSCVLGSCPQGFTCVNGECIVHIQCKSYLDCTEGKTCTNNICSFPSCYDDSYCSKEKPYCVNGVCQPQELQIITSCKRNDDCPSNHYCSVLRRCMLKIKCPLCPHDMTCDKMSKQCVNIKCDGKTNYCPRGRTCKNSQCILKKACDCKKGEKCINGDCRKTCDQNPECPCNSYGLCRIDNKCTKTECQAKYYCDSSSSCNIPQCMLSKDCLEGKVCAYGVCIDAQVSDCRDCKRSKENLTCLWDRCIPDISCNERKKCKEGFTCDITNNVCFPENVCDTDKDCAYPTVCVNNLCKVTRIESCLIEYQLFDGRLCLPKKKCIVSNDCGDNEFCRHGNCLIGCMLDANCKQGQYCSVYGICTKERNCEACEEGEICIDGKCNTVECIVDEDCPYSFPICNKGACQRPYLCDHKCKNCVNGLCLKEKCKPKCQDWEICENGECYPDHIICKQKCPKGMVCKKNVCKPCTDKSCSITSKCDKCPLNSLCKHGKCQNICSSNQGCPARENCINGICMKVSNCPCSFGEVCAGGFCKQQECFQDGDCLLNSICQYGRCIYASPCNVNYNCASNEVCINNQCKSTSCDCEEYEECFENICFIPSVCRFERHCPNGMFCDVGTKTCRIRKCMANQDCGSKNLQCMNEEKCVPKTGCKYGCSDQFMYCNKISNRCEPKCFFNTLFKCGTSCSKFPCPSNFACIGKQCKQQFDCRFHPCTSPQICRQSENYNNQYICVNPQCLGDNDCGPKEYCLLGQCERPCREHCPQDHVCENGRCVMVQMCPCSDGFYCGADNRCYPSRLCVPERSDCGYNELCRKVESVYRCVERKCKDRCIYPSEVCDFDTQQCKTTLMCQTNSDCVHGKCCDRSARRCLPCCSQETCKEGSCSQGVCVPVEPETPSIFCILDRCKRIDCFSDIDCGDDICFYGLCVKRPRSCRLKQCKIIVDWPWIVLAEITIFSKSTQAVTMDLHCNDIICIPNIKCYINLHCPDNTYCKNNICQIKSCKKDRDCVNGLCKSNTCFIKVACSRDFECKDGQICYDGTCKTSCKPNSCKIKGQSCQLTTVDEGFCETILPCKTSFDCPHKQMCDTQTKTCKIQLVGCPLGYNLITGECQKNTRCNGKCPKGYICHASNQCLKVVECYKRICDPGYICDEITQKCISQYPCNTDYDCIDNMQCVENRCVHITCSRDTCVGPDHECQIGNFGRICLPNPTCRSHLQCLSSERCVNQQCRKLCYSNAECGLGFLCTNHACIRIIKCDKNCASQQYCDHATQTCRSIECQLDAHCFPGSTCYFGQCVNRFILCKNNDECPEDSYCLGANKSTYLKKVCIPFVPCNGHCRPGEYCDNNLNVCIHKIRCNLNEECPAHMKCIADEYGLMKICRPVQCKLSSEQCDCQYGICLPTLITILCSANKDCQNFNPSSKCILGKCKSETKCVLHINADTIIPSKCTPQCQFHADCPRNFNCLDGSCIRKSICKNCESNEQCYKGKCVKPSECDEDFHCKAPMVCTNNRCTQPVCMGENCECIMHDICPTEPHCSGSAVDCMKLAMVCKDNMCIMPMCTRDSECNGLYCMDGECRTVNECKFDSNNCICMGEKCFQEKTCPCPRGYECFASQFCVPIGINCFSDNHCPEHMTCEEGICKILHCTTNKDCSFSRECHRRGDISICVPLWKEKCTAKNSESCPVCDSALDCPQAGMLCSKGKCKMPTPCDLCLSGEICMNGECMKKCKTKCKRGYLCFHGNCIKVKDEKCPAGQSKVDKFGCQPMISCYTNSNCPPPMHCNSESQRCINYCNKDCPTNYKCIDKRCQPDVQVEECYHSNECSPVTYCDNLLHQCQHYCLQDTECDDNKKCLAGKCIPSGPCDNCGDLQQCRNKRCVAIECSSWHTCGPDEVCKYGQCVTVAECQEDRDCLFGYECIKNICLPFKSCRSCNENEICRKINGVSLCIPIIACSGLCPVGMACNEGQCIPVCGKKECKVSEHCVNEECYEFTVTNPKCTKDVHCGSSQVCKDNLCITVECLKDTDCSVDNEICITNKCIPLHCEKDHDCPRGLNCHMGACQTCPNVNEYLLENTCQAIQCQENVDCPSPYICKQRKCVVCQGNDDCPIGKSCKQITGNLHKCVNIIESCKYSADCNLGYKCVDEVCRLSCLSDSNCNLGETCERETTSVLICMPVCSRRCNGLAQQCKPTKCFVPECRKDTDCKGNKFCSGGYCINLIQCQSNGDCQDNQNCVLGTCLFEASCKLSDDCPYGKICRNNICLPDEVRCKLDIHCPEMMRCRNNICHWSKCSKDYHCANAGYKLRKCQKGICVPFCVGSSCKGCKSDSDCVTGGICKEGKCEVRNQDFSGKIHCDA